MSACPCGCGQEVPQPTRNWWVQRDPYWEWRCPNPLCPRGGQVMWNQSGDAECSWCGRTRDFIGHFAPGNSTDGGTNRRMVSGRISHRPSGTDVIRRTPAWAIRPFRDVT